MTIFEDCYCIKSIKLPMCVLLTLLLIGCKPTRVPRAQAQIGVRYESALTEIKVSVGESGTIFCGLGIRNQADFHDVSVSGPINSAIASLIKRKKDLVGINEINKLMIVIKGDTFRVDEVAEVTLHTCYWVPNGQD